MDCSVNVGLGAGSKERDLSVLQIVLGLQKELLSAIGPDNPFVKPHQLYNVLAKMTEAAGFPSADPYFTRPDDNEIATKIGADQGPSEMDKAIEGQMRLEQVKLRGRAESERARLAAEVQLREAELASEVQLQAQKAEQARASAMLQNEIDLLMHREKLQLEREKAGLSRVPWDPMPSGDSWRAEPDLPNQPDLGDRELGEPDFGTGWPDPDYRPNPRRPNESA